MNPAIWVAIYLPIIVAIIAATRNKRQMMRHIIRMKKLKIRGADSMNELIKSWLGKDCIVITFEGTQIKGVMETAESNWVCIRTPKGPEMVNLDFISRIRQNPKPEK